jgi:hypothetical protein
MYSLLTRIWKRAKRTYHKGMHTYHSILYRDCLDMQMKERIYTKMLQHEEQMNHYTR